MMKVPMTVEGAERLKAELQRLKSVERPAIIQAIAEARSHGDLSENAEYHSAKEQQSLNEGRIAELESLIARAEVIDVNAQERRITLSLKKMELEGVEALKYSEDRGKEDASERKVGPSKPAGPAR